MHNSDNKPSKIRSVQEYYLVGKVQLSAFDEDIRAAEINTARLQIGTSEVALFKKKKNHSMWFSKKSFTEEQHRRNRENQLEVVAAELSRAFNFQQFPKTKLLHFGKDTNILSKAFEPFSSFQQIINKREKTSEQLLDSFINGGGAALTAIRFLFESIDDNPKNTGITTNDLVVAIDIDYFETLKNEERIFRTIGDIARKQKKDTPETSSGKKNEFDKEHQSLPFFASGDADRMQIINSYAITDRTLLALPLRSIETDQSGVNIGYGAYNVICDFVPNQDLVAAKFLEELYFRRQLLEQFLLCIIIGDQGTVTKLVKRHVNNEALAESIINRVCSRLEKLKDILLNPENEINDYLHALVDFDRLQQLLDVQIKGFNADTKHIPNHLDKYEAYQRFGVIKKQLSAQRKQKYHTVPVKSKSPSELSKFSETVSSLLAAVCNEIRKYPHLCEGSDSCLLKLQPFTITDETKYPELQEYFRVLSAVAKLMARFGDLKSSELQRHLLNAFLNNVLTKSRLQNKIDSQICKAIALNDDLSDESLYCDVLDITVTQLLNTISNDPSFNRIKSDLQKLNIKLKPTLEKLNSEELLGILHQINLSNTLIVFLNSNINNNNETNKITLKAFGIRVLECLISLIKTTSDSALKENISFNQISDKQIQSFKNLIESLKEEVNIDDEFLSETLLTICKNNETITTETFKINFDLYKKIVLPEHNSYISKKGLILDNETKLSIARGVWFEIRNQQQLEEIYKPAENGSSISKKSQAESRLRTNITELRDKGLTFAREGKFVAAKAALNFSHSAVQDVAQLKRNGPVKNQDSIKQGIFSRIHLNASKANEKLKEHRSWGKAFNEFFYWLNFLSTAWNFRFIPLYKSYMDKHRDHCMFPTKSEQLLSCIEKDAKSLAENSIPRLRLKPTSSAA